MERIEKRLGSYTAKTCPRCGAELYADLAICYGCLYDFSRDAGSSSLAEIPALSPDKEDTIQFDRVELGIEQSTPDTAGMHIDTSALKVWINVPEEGLLLGRDASCDVVLHSSAVSRRHLRVKPTPEGMEVCDLGSTNPAVYRGRTIDDCVVVSYGDTIDLCDCRLTMTGHATYQL